MFPGATRTKLKNLSEVKPLIEIPVYLNINTAKSNVKQFDIQSYSAIMNSHAGQTAKAELLL